jgi:hypothetical protein
VSIPKLDLIIDIIPKSKSYITVTQVNQCFHLIGFMMPDLVELLWGNAVTDREQFDIVNFFGNGHSENLSLPDRFLFLSQVG